jgi:hypothetical protein
MALVVAQSTSVRVNVVPGFADAIDPANTSDPANALGLVLATVNAPHAVVVQLPETRPNAVVPMFLNVIIASPPVQYVSTTSTPVAVLEVNIPDMYVYAIPANAMVIISIRIVAITADTPFI